jgi:hypothetical protein
LPLSFARSLSPSTVTGFDSRWPRNRASFFTCRATETGGAGAVAAQIGRILWRRWHRPSSTIYIRDGHGDMEEKRSEEKGMRLDYGGPRSLPPNFDVTPTSQSVDSSVRTLRPLRFKDLGMRLKDDMTQEEAYSVELCYRPRITRRIMRNVRSVSETLGRRVRLCVGGGNVLEGRLLLLSWFHDASDQTE